MPMYKKIISSAIFALLVTSGIAQTQPMSNTLTDSVRAKMGLSLLGKLNQVQMNQTQMSANVRGVAASEPLINVLVRMQPGNDASLLETYGVQVKSSAMGFSSVSATAQQLATLAADARVKHLSFINKVKPLLNESHPRTGVDRIKAADGLTQPYTGKGVLALMEDLGLQPTHTMLLREDGTPKIEYYRQGDGAILTTREELDNVRDYYSGHGTHTASVLLGSKVTSDGLTLEGVAPGASMAYFQAEEDSTRYISDSYTPLLALMAYAEKDPQRPMVANFSIGTMGMEVMDDNCVPLLEALGKKLPVCVAVGNNGWYDDCVYHVCSEGSDKLFFLADAYQPEDHWIEDWMSYYIATQNDKPLKVTLMIVHGKDVLYQMPVIDRSTNGRFTYLSGKPEDADNDEYLHSDVFTEHFGGRLGVCSKVDDQGRYVVMVSLDDVNMVRTDYRIAFLVEAEAGQVVKASGCGAAYLSSAKDRVFDDAIIDCVTPDGNTNVWALAENVISVGAYSVRVTDDDIRYGEELDSLTSFSSYGHLLNGRTVPEITAPGQYIYAGFNKYSIEDAPIFYIDNSDDPLVSAYGTSMSAPYVAGVVALWLEADPTLSVTDIREIMASTAIKDKYVTNTKTVAWGNGKIDAYSGLKEVLNRATASLYPIAADKDFMMRQQGQLVEVFVAGESSLTANLYTIGGKRVASTRGVGSQLTLDASSVPPGVYVLQVQGAFTSHSAKIVIR